MSEEDNGNGRKHPTWKFLAVTVIGVVFVMAGYGYARHDIAIDKLDETKADKEVLNFIIKQNEDIKKSINDLIALHITDRDSYYKKNK